MLLLIPSLPVCLGLLGVTVWGSHAQFCLSCRIPSCPSDPKALRGSAQDLGSAAEPLFPHGGEGEEELGQITVILAFCVCWGREIVSMCS